jgi:hypothetical protein
MKIRDRLLFILGGLLAIIAGYEKAQQSGPIGPLDFRGQQRFPGSAIGIGIFLIIVGVLPAGKWLERLTSIKTKQDRHH